MPKKTATRRSMGDILSDNYGESPRPKLHNRKANMRWIMEQRKRDARKTRNRPTASCDECGKVYCAEYVRIIDTWSGTIQVCDFCRRSK